MSTPISALATIHRIHPRTPSRVPSSTDHTVSQWEAISPTERIALAHLRGWTHHGPACPLCMAGGAS